MRGHLHLLERLDHVFKFLDGSGNWASGYWQLDEIERRSVRKLFLHKTKAERSFWGGDVLHVVPATEFAEMAARHATDPAGRWLLIVRPSPEARNIEWEGSSHAMAYKSLAQR